MQLPDYKMVQGGNTRVNMSAGAASQVGKAFANMGKDLENAGMQVSGMFEEAERQHNIGKMADLQLELDQTRSEFDQKMAANPNDAVNWRQGWANVMDKKQKEIDARDMSGTLRDQTNLYVKKFSGKEGISVSHKAHSTMLGNARDSVAAVIADRRIRGDFDGSDAHTDKAVAEGLMTTAAGQEQKLANARGREKKDVEDQVLTDPYAAETNFATRKFDTEGDRDNALKAAIQHQHYVENTTSDEFYNKIAAGLPVTEDEIEAAFHPDAAVARVKVQDHLREYNSLSTKARRATPQYQERIKGDLTAMLSGLDVSKSGFQSERRDARALIEQIDDSTPEGKADKEEFLRVLARIDAREPAFQSAVDQSIARSYANGTLKKPKLDAKEVTFQDRLRDGHLGFDTLSQTTNLKHGDLIAIDNLSKAGKYAEAVKLFGQKMRPMGRGGFKKDIAQWQTDFLLPLTSEKPPTFTTVSHVANSQDPDAILKFEYDSRVHATRIAGVKRDMAGWMDGKNPKDIPAGVMDEEMRKRFLFHSEERAEKQLADDDAAERKANKITVEYTADGFLPDIDTRKKNWAKKESYVSLDANDGTHVGVENTQPLVVLPKNASKELTEAGHIYAGLMLNLHKTEFGRKDFKSQVVISGSPMGKPKNGEKQKVWNGKQHVTHLEGFSITDKKMVAFLKTKRGKAVYRQILSKSFGKVHGVTMGLPHSENDGGAKNTFGDDEVSLSRWILSDDEPEKTTSLVKPEAYVGQDYRFGEQN